MLGVRVAQAQTPSPSTSPRWLRIGAFLLVIALAFVNAVAFPRFTGFPGGANPLADSFQALPHLALAIANGIVLALAVDVAPGRARSRFGWLILLTAATRLAYLAFRTMQGASAVDPDVALYFRYAQSFAGGNYPAMEYPQGALLAFTGAYLLAAADAGRFAVVMPLLTLVFELITVACLFALGERFKHSRVAWSVGLCYAISPLTLVLWYGKYDAIPAGLLALGIYLFAVRRHYLSAISLAAGFLAKWFPGIAIAFFVAHLAHTRNWRAALSYLVIAGLSILLPIGLFWSISPELVLHTYTFHETRPLMGESLPYIAVYFLEPAARLAAGTSPWTDVDNSPFGNPLATALQLGGIVLALAACSFKRQRESAIALSAVGVTLFIVLNRVFSPQYTLVLLVAYMVALVVLPAPRRLPYVAPSVLLLLTLLNYYVWPLWTPQWLLASALFFAANLALAGYLAVQSLRLRTNVD